MYEAQIGVLAFERSESVQIRIFDVNGDHLSGGSGERWQVDARAWTDLKRASNTGTPSINCSDDPIAF
jgi:hypothetical protein